MSAPIVPLDVSTLCAHAGTGSGDGTPLTTPIVQSTTFCRDGVDSTCAHQYSRVSNPTVAALEESLGHLEAALPALCFASGLAAETALFLGLVSSGDHVVCGRAVYGGTTRLLRQILAPLGVETTFVDATDTAAIAGAVRDRTRVIFLETPANPTLELTDIAAASRIARACGATLVVDNTFLTPVLQRPLDLGADATVSATTKFTEGHSVAVGGAIVTRDAALRERIRFIRKSTGGIQTPFGAWLTINGLKTLPIRIHRQSASAAEVAAWLAAHPSIDRAIHPSLPSFPQRELADLQHLGAHGAVVAFEVAGGAEVAKRVASSVRLCRVVEHVGSVETLLTHPASMTHADVPARQRAEVGITDGLLRLSVGLESPAAIIADLEQAIGAAVAIAPASGEGVRPWAVA
jgi:cystathionine beta-lyase/cystathionine gamma-synthase